MTFRMPAEWARQDWIWIGFPAHGDLWEDNLAAAQEQMAAFANAVAETGQAVRLMVRDAATEMRAKDLVSGAVQFERHPYGDIWIRDTGPLTVLDNGGERRAQGFGFNGWGGKYLLEGDQQTGPSLAKAGELPYARADWILEGGAVESDGTGLVVTTEQCLLNPNRNPDMDQAAIEAEIAGALGVTEFIWLGDGLLNDHTDGHVDNIARFIAPGHAICQHPSGADDPNADTLQEIETALRRAGLEVTTIPSPGLVKDEDGNPIPASHMNFTITNGVVLVPVYEDRYSLVALAELSALFEGRKVIGLPARHILNGGGSFHCMTREIPA